MHNRFVSALSQRIVSKLRPLMLMALLCPWVQLFPIALSQEATVSLLTCGPGSELYTSWGHTALRITDTKLGFDRVYNYGTFNFAEEGFYWKFLRGKLPYYLSVDPFSRFLADYAFQEREVAEQILNLSGGEATEIFLFLENNLRPENRAYPYDFIRDNCTTRIRNLFHKQLQPEALQKEITEHSAREHLLQCLNPLPWTGLGINLLLGARVDQPLDAYQTMFLPALLMEQMANSHYSASQLPLVKETRILLQGKQSTRPSPITGPLLLLTLLLAVSIGAALFPAKLSVANRLFDRMLFGAIGLIGCVIAFMWFVSIHYGTSLNWNLLLLSPVCLLYAFRRKPWRRTTLHCFLLFLLISLLLYPVALLASRQAIGVETGLIALLVGFRALYLYRVSRSAKPKPI